jgi:hypothetical protein
MDSIRLKAIKHELEKQGLVDDSGCGLYYRGWGRLWRIKGTHTLQASCDTNGFDAWRYCDNDLTMDIPEDTRKIEACFWSFMKSLVPSERAAQHHEKEQDRLCANKDKTNSVKLAMDKLYKKRKRKDEKRERKINVKAERAAKVRMAAKTDCGWKLETLI